LIAPKTADPERPTPQARSERPNSSQAYHPTPSQGPEPVSRIRKTNRYADRSTQRRPRIPSILSTFSTAKPAVRAGQATHRAARKRLIWRMHDGCQTRSSPARHFSRNRPADRGRHPSANRRPRRADPAPARGKVMTGREQKPLTRRFTGGKGCSYSAKTVPG